MNRSANGVKRVIDTFKEKEEVNFRRVIKNPTPPKISEKTRKYLILLSKRDRRKSLPALTEEMNSVLDHSVSQSTVRSSLLSFGLNGRVACKKPLLRQANIRKRLKFAQEHVTWTESQWAKVLFTDETKVEIFGSHRRIFVRRMVGERYKNQCLVPTVKFGGGSIMVWGAVSVKGVLPLHKIEGKMTKETYHQILIRQVSFAVTFAI